MHFFVFPVSFCNSSCKYCFGINNPQSVMDQSVFRKAILLFSNLVEDRNGNNTKLSFHGGEPLLAGSNFYKNVLPVINNTFNNTVKIGIQSNLWNINDKFLKLFKEYNIRVGTSLDGPNKINDFQRSKGYYSRTMQGMKKLHKQGISTGCIATFTSNSALNYKDVFKFFMENDMPFEIHSAIKPYEFIGDNKLFLSPVELGNLFIDLLDLYLLHTDKIKIGTLDTFIKNISRDKSGLCTFTKCLGNYLAVDPIGDLYTCNRFVGNKEFSVGNVKNVSSWADIKHSQVWQKLENWQKLIDKECADCLHKNICHGGCMYAGFAAGNGKSLKDPNCEAYKMIYKYILDKGTEELFSEKNIEAISQKNTSGKSSLLRKGSLLQVMNDDPHPYDIKRLSKKIIAAGLLGITEKPDRVTDILFSLDIVKSKDNASVVIEKLHKELTEPADNYVNLYLHITGNCNLRCSHCYSYTAEEEKTTYLSLTKISTSIEDAKNAGFKKIILTGGEPLLYPDFENLLDFLIELKKSEKLPKMVLRTNLSVKIDDKTVEKISQVFDQIAVSIDGTENFHDIRRGKGTYRQTTNNIQRFAKKILQDKVTLSTVLNYQTLSEQTIENIKQHIINLKEKYGLFDIRFLPLLPIGRAENAKVKRLVAENISVADWISKAYSPRSSCGLGHNLMIDSDGSAYPCHIYKKDKYNLNNISVTTLQEIIEQDNFKKLRQINVNTIKKCSKCKFRYLCGGVCKVWQDTDCRDLYQRAENLFYEALDILNITICKMEQLLRQ